MKVCDVIHGRTKSMEVRATSGAFPTGLIATGEVAVLEIGGDPHLQFGEESIAVDVMAGDSLVQILAETLPRLCWLAQVTPASGPAERLVIEVREFPNLFRWNEPVQIGINDQIVEDMRKRRKK